MIYTLIFHEHKNVGYSILIEFYIDIDASINTHQKWREKPHTNLCKLFEKNFDQLCTYENIFVSSIYRSWQKRHQLLKQWAANLRNSNPKNVIIQNSLITINILKLIYMKFNYMRTYSWKLIIRKVILITDIWYNWVKWRTEYPFEKSKIAKSWWITMKKILL